MNYAEVLQAIQDWTENDATEFVDNIPLMITLGEHKIYREADFNRFRTSGNVTLTANNSIGTAPADMIAPRWLRISGGAHLLPKDDSFIRTFQAASTSGTPRYYAWVTDGTTFEVAPTPSANTTLVMGYTYRPTGLSSGNTTTWLATTYPDLLLYSVLLEAMGFMKEEVQEKQMWAEQYQRCLKAAVTEQLGRGRTDEYRAGEIRPIRG